MEERLLKEIRSAHDAGPAVDPQTGEAALTRFVSSHTMQQGFFRLLQGAAYRVHRMSYAANCETHTRVTQLPYVLPEFVKFVGATVDWYKTLAVVDSSAHVHLDALVESVNGMLSELKQRVDSFDEAKLSAGQRKAYEGHLERMKAKSTKTAEWMKLSAQAEPTSPAKGKLLWKMAGHGAKEVHSQRLEEMTKEAEKRQAPAGPPTTSKREALAKWKDETWNYVFMDSSAAETPGGMVPVSYWYEDFMPKLLTAFSITQREDAMELAKPQAMREASDDDWFAKTKDAGEFENYGQDILWSWSSLTPVQKRCVRQAWRLTRQYLNGLQKEREREEDGAEHRHTGYLSEYVCFVDVGLGRSDIRDAGMRISFPYYIGPAVWTMFHSSAEIVCGMPAQLQTQACGKFRDFILSFAWNYPCPYCRHHFNAYVKLTRETSLYPLEYLLLGWTEPGPQKVEAMLKQSNGDHASLLEVTAEQKFASITDGPSLRLFLWKLHNAVSSSIQRSEEWFHTERMIIGTNRHWPSMRYDLARASGTGTTMLVARVAAVYRVEEYGAELSRLREDLVQARYEDATAFLNTARRAKEVIALLDKHVEESGFLQKGYCFDPSAPEEVPHDSLSGQRFARSGDFSLV